MFEIFNFFEIHACSADFTIILISFICLILETEVSVLIFLASARPFKLIRYMQCSCAIMYSCTAHPFMHSVHRYWQSA